MGDVQAVRPVKLICGILAREESWLDAAREVLLDRVAAIEDVSPVWPFDQTDYYRPQMGGPLLRRFVSFRGVAQPSALMDTKLRTNQLEAELAGRLGGDVPRPVNLDPGYIALDKLVLATTKDYSHRLYLGQGIYGEVTLYYQKGRWHCWPWTYPDYAELRYHAFFAAVRHRLKSELAEASERT